MANNPNRFEADSPENVDSRGDAGTAQQAFTDEMAKVEISEKMKEWDDAAGHHKGYSLGGTNVYEVITNDKTHSKTEISRDVMGRVTGRRDTRDGTSTATFSDGFDTVKVIHARDGSTTVLKKQDDGSFAPAPQDERADLLEKEKEEFRPPSVPRPRARG